MSSTDRRTLLEGAAGSVVCSALLAWGWTLRPEDSGGPQKSAPVSGVTSVTKPAGDPKKVTVVSAAGTVLVDATIVPGLLGADGVLAPPRGLVGWYAEPGWPKPGWPGTAILAGHINRRSTGESDVFAQLTQVAPGDVITVTYSTGQAAVFRANRSEPKSKAEVPGDNSIWDPTNAKPLLRLITCDPTTPLDGGHYVGNWVVWADLSP